jgi:hypothetical protein
LGCPGNWRPCPVARLKRASGCHGTMTLCGNRNQKKKQQAKDVEAWVKRDSKDEGERSFGCRSAFTMEDGHGAWTSHGEGDEATKRGEIRTDE